jgi:hypothetical protein
MFNRLKVIALWQSGLNPAAHSSATAGKPDCYRKLILIYWRWSLLLS